MVTVKWSATSENGRFQQGTATWDKVNAELRRRAVRAKRREGETGADHVLYAIQLYNRDNTVKEIRFFMHPMGETEFRKQTSIKNSIIYAIHHR